MISLQILIQNQWFFDSVDFPNKLIYLISHHDSLSNLIEFQKSYEITLILCGINLIHHYTP